MSDRATDTTDIAGVAIRPPVLVLLGILAGVALDYILPASLTGGTLPSTPRLILGFAILGAGIALLVWAMRCFRRAGTNVQTSHPTLALVGVGPYAYSRNPIYVAFALDMAGIAIAADNLWIAMAIIPVVLVLGSGVIAREEAYLERKFGGSYLAYKASVRRWL